MGKGDDGNSGPLQTRPAGDVTPVGEEKDELGYTKKQRHHLSLLMLALSGDADLGVQLCTDIKTGEDCVVIVVG